MAQRRQRSSHHDPGRGARRARGQRLARGLGWFSVGLGLAQAIAPRPFARLLGVGERSRLMRGLGAREIATGIGILTTARGAAPVWGRVAGDAMDLALLEKARRAGAPDDRRVRAAMVAVAGLAVLDAYTAEQLAKDDERTVRRSQQAITIQRPREEVYAFWRDFENLPRFFLNVSAVDVIDERRSRWRVQGPAGLALEWEAELADDRPGEHIAWRSLPGADVDNAGSVYFVDAPAGRGTEVYLDLRYYPPAGAAGVALAKLFRREPGQQAEDDLRRLKQVLETGQVVHSDASYQRGKRAARPASGEPRSDDETLTGDPFDAAPWSEASARDGAIPEETRR